MGHRSCCHRQELASARFKRQNLSYLEILIAIASTVTGMLLTFYRSGPPTCVVKLGPDWTGLGYSRNRVREMEILIAVASVAIEIIKPLVGDVLIAVASVAVEIIKPLVAPIRRHIGYLTGYELNIKNLKEELQKLKIRKLSWTLATPYSIIQWQKQVDDIIKKGDEFFQNENKCFNTNCPDPMSRYSLSKKAKEMTETVLDLLKKTEEFAEEAKSCFLLCSLFPEDFDIRVEDLVRYGMGLRLFKNVDKVHHARTRVYNLIDKLKESFLLLEGYGHDYVKMHDIVRDVAISIASRDKQWHMLQSEAKMKEWLEKDGYKHCIAVSLLYEEISDQLNDLEDERTQSSSFVFEFPSLLQSLDVLRNLRTLSLVVFNEHWGRAIGALVKLEILEIHGSTDEIVADRNYAKVLQLRYDASDIKETGMKVLMGKAEVLDLIRVINMKEVISTDECVEQGYLVDALQGIPRLPEIQLPYFGKLRELNIQSCDVLKYFIPLSMAKGLRQLHKISVEFCKEMEGIFYNSEVDDEVEFPELTDLMLSYLPNFLGFIINKSLSWKVQTQDFTVLQVTPNIGKDIDQPSTSQRNNSTEIEHAQAGPAEMISIFLCQRLSNLQKLDLRNCDSSTLKNSFDQSGLSGKEVMYPTRLVRRGRKQKDVSNKEVSLIKNQEDPSVSHIDEKTRKCYAFPSKLIERLQNLKNLRICDCDSMEVIFSFEGLSPEECHATTGVLNSMEEMRFETLSNLKHVCFKIPSEIKAFQNLKMLKVESCDNLINLFSPGLAKLLVKLQKIKITSCKMMEEIIGKEDEEKQEESMQKIVFPQLSSLTFGNLPNFKGFYSGIYALELPKIQKLKIFDEKCTVNESLLTRLLIRRKNTLRRIEDGQPSDGDLSNVRVLYVENCQDWVNLIPYILIECVQKLEELSVDDCGSLMEIFDFEGLNADGGNVVTLSHLEEVQLSNLPKLVHIFNKIPKNVIGFQKLRKLDVYDCNSLRNILSVAVAKCLVQLQELDIGSCYMLEEIIVPKEDEKEEEASKDKIMFPQLKSLAFESLPSLKSFCNGIYALEFPLLENLNFMECNGMKTFSYGSLSMPKLKELIINYENHQLMGSPDLNSTMSHLFKGDLELWDCWILAIALVSSDLFVVSLGFLFFWWSWCCWCRVAALFFFGFALFFFGLLDVLAALGTCCLLLVMGPLT
ncbi:hypothetical protein GH714_016592 [Hevea brasiliensis]|uniref:Disease resistance protein At4g27190-like leucine-rich repeats domain-containing protein n=1 Tax=Hevea brasiliensis TaxID=3981 RepID=A0A6A6KPJ5_HEVBR|nr:hypothetical protein GH714_016592 [Hevea brasiliensis]